MNKFSLAVVIAMSVLSFAIGAYSGVMAERVVASEQVAK